jgi:hypothetical protein
VLNKSGLDAVTSFFLINIILIGRGQCLNRWPLGQQRSVNDKLINNSTLDAVPSFYNTSDLIKQHINIFVSSLD